MTAAEAWSGSASGAGSNGTLMSLPEMQTGATSMRMMLRVTFPTDIANGAIKSGSFQQVMEAMMNKLKPESAYFMATNGCRSAMLFFDMQDASEIPSIAEPLLAALNAEIELQPVMNADDLKKGLSAAMQR